jgi:hypothetical protein
MLSVSLLVNQMLYWLKAAMSVIVMSCVTLTSWYLSEDVGGKSMEAKGVLGSMSVRYMSPVKPSISAWMEPSVVMVELISMVYESVFVSRILTPWISNLASSILSCAMLGTPTKMLEDMGVSEEPTKEQSPIQSVGKEAREKTHTRHTTKTTIQQKARR